MSSESRETDRASTVLTLSARTVAWGWGITTCSLTVASVLSQLYRFAVRDGRSRGWVERLYLDQEQSISTWFQSATLLACAALLYTIAAAKRRDRDPHARAWRGLALIFLCLSLDEVAALHELTTAPLRNLLHAGGMWHFAWVVPGAAFVLAVGVLYVRFLIELPARTRWRFVFAGVAYVGGALGMEMVSGAYVAGHGVNTPIYAIGLVTAEELLEMVGMSVFLYALVSYLADHVGSVHVRAVFRPPP